MYNTIDIIYRNLHNSTLRFEPYINSFAYILSTVYLGFFILNRYFLGLEEEHLIIRIVICILGIGLLLRNYWPSRLKYIFPIYWYFTLWFSLPFFFLFTLLQNVDSNVWQINGLVGLVMLSYFVNWVEYAILSLSGFIFAVILSYIVNPDFEFSMKIAKIIVNYSAPIIYFIVFSNKLDQDNKDKFKALKALAGSIAHELRTPLAALRIRGLSNAKTANKLLEAYDNLNTEADPFDILDDRERRNLKQASRIIDNIANESMMIIDMILTKLKDPVHVSTQEVLSINYLIQSALEAYPLSEEQRAKIHVDIQDDFTFSGNQILVQHVLFNLIEKAGKGDITITTISKDKNYNNLYFKDIGPGIESDILLRLFERFNSKTDRGTGLGLAFCKTA